MKFVIITGLSGAGKSRTAEFLEDAGYYTVDNIPAGFLPYFVRFCLHANGRYDRVAMVSDLRSGDGVEPLLTAIGQIREFGCDCSVLFLEADLACVIRRYKETRRQHPLAAEGRSLEETVDRERELLRPVRETADLVLDTTPFTSSDMLRAALKDLFQTDSNGSTLSLTLLSFGYKYGLPLEADFVLDVRFLPNPYYVEGLKELTGRDEPVWSYLNSFQVTGQFLDKLDDLLSFLLVQFAEEGRSTLTLAFGCTGGRHRSVAMACAVAQRLRGRGRSVSLSHRDIGRG